MREAAVPAVVRWARELQAVAQTGLAYEEPSAFDRMRYEQVRRVAAEMLAAADGAEAAAWEAELARESGHATPKLDVRAVAFREDGILLVRERADGLWTLPGGWADVGESPSTTAERELREESGFAGRAVELLALLDRDRHDHPPHPWHTWKVLIRCELLDEPQAPLGPETDAAGFFPLEALPPLSLPRVTERQLARLFEHREHPEWPADLD